jgi:hypothetical protein
MKENGDAAVLLNGAFVRHICQPPYRKSRGLVFLDIFIADYPSQAFCSFELSEIEPFTMIIFEKGRLYEFRWNGEDRFGRMLPADQPHIWSSVTLYDGIAARKRELWLAKFLDEHPLPTQQEVINFHRCAGEGNRSSDLLMTRNGKYSTVSITGISLNQDRALMTYIDVNSHSSYDVAIGLLKAI